ncbi:MAG: HPr family phosphocarrier protein [Calditrichia bacterium]|nr:HPr family phosphocarrier protein [Calditrichia bacterium]
MIKKTIKITSVHGLHARPASLFVRTATQFKSEVKIHKDGMVVNGKSIMGVMMLAAEKGSKIELELSGEDEKKLLEAIEELFEKNFYEEN